MKKFSPIKIPATLITRRREKFLKSINVVIMKLTLETLIEEAENFTKLESQKSYPELLGVSDGKRIGTYIEHEFKNYLKLKYEFNMGSSAQGIDFPDPEINTDIKVTSTKKPQSSSPFKNIEQKIYGLGHNILLFVYKKYEINNQCHIKFKHCIFISSDKTADYNLTKKLRKLIRKGAGEKEIIKILNEKNIPGDEDVLKNLAKKIISNPPNQGYLTISNALQWRLKYSNAINFKNQINGKYKYGKIQ